MNAGMIVVGDRTDHGGEVISGSLRDNINGRPIARVGDMVSCPRCRGVFPIAQGDGTFIIEGAPLAYHGCKTSCGATLIASQMTTTTNPNRHPLSGGTSTPSTENDPTGTAPVGDIGHGLTAGYEHQPTDDQTPRFRGRFRLIDQATGNPIAGRNVRVRSTGGQSLATVTDDEGYTPWIEGDSAEALAFDLIDP